MGVFPGALKCCAGMERGWRMGDAGTRGCGIGVQEGLGMQDWVDRMEIWEEFRGCRMDTW